MFHFAPSQLNLLYECPKCFWLAHVAKFSRPRGIFPGIMGGIDRLIQAETTRYAGKSRPVWLLPDLKTKGVIRKGAKRFKVKGDNYSITGIVDDIVVINGAENIIVDYKTAASPHSQEDTKKYYQRQLDMYAFLLERNNLKVHETGYIVYTTPHYIGKKTAYYQMELQFQVTHVPLSVTAQGGEAIINEALKVCGQAKSPPANPNCEYCKYRGR